MTGRSRETPYFSFQKVLYPLPEATWFLAWLMTDGAKIKWITLLDDVECHTRSTHTYCDKNDNNNSSKPCSPRIWWCCHPSRSLQSWYHWRFSRCRIRIQTKIMLQPWSINWLNSSKLACNWARRIWDVKWNCTRDPPLQECCVGPNHDFSTFGETMNTASCIERTGKAGKIQVSKTKAELIQEAGKQHWLTKRDGIITAKGKGEWQVRALSSLFTFVVKLARRGSDDWHHHQQSYWNDLPSKVSFKLSNVRGHTAILPKEVQVQMKEFVAPIASMYRQVPLHNFEHKQVMFQYVPTKELVKANLEPSSLRKFFSLDSPRFLIARACSILNWQRNELELLISSMPRPLAEQQNSVVVAWE